MFRFHKTLDVITLFHKASSPASVRAATLLKQVSATASESATEDQASDHSSQHSQRSEFDLEITENPPTPDQVSTILDYVGPEKIPSIIQGVSTPSEALKKFKENSDSFQRPVVVDWSNGKAISGGNESAILKMLEGLKK